MNWQLLKTNWFSLALAFLLLAAISRNNSSFLKGCSFSKIERFATSPTLKQGNAALGLAMESAPKHASPVEVDHATAQAFFKRFSEVALSERKKFGIPASLLLAISFVNSQSGMGTAAAEANNFFSLPCTEDWEGEQVSLGDNCFREYESPWASWRDFSIYLTSQTWFGSLKQSAGKDSKKWATGVQNKGLSNVARFSQKLVEVIEFYHLQKYDQ